MNKVTSGFLTADSFPSRWPVKTLAFRFDDTASTIFPVCGLRTAPDRFEFFVKSRSHSKAEFGQHVSVQRQRKLPSAQAENLHPTSLPRVQQVLQWRHRKHSHG